ncbi:MAG: transaldolase [Candidatus Omnitrophica bacterium]|nr:transaldolase [Candidatus Omnitrophota bacterium]MCB9722311.1 transaldolase [Candidatus Omnitrophota bacterium]
MAPSTIQQLADYGQSIWLDYINRPMLENGELKQRIANGLRGMTSNPSIFQKAIGTTHDYDQEIIRLKAEGKSAFEIYDALTIRDIQDAADCFRDVYERTGGLDGYVSLEINPLLAAKVEEQAAEGIRLFEKVDRPNVMIKVPSTEQGYAVIRTLIGRGINVNATLIFSLNQYEQVAAAYCAGVSDLQSAGGDLSAVHSVASVFVSRIDSVIDKNLEEISAEDAALADEAGDLAGQAAVANSRIIFERAETLFGGPQFKALAAAGANRQRVLWGSTSTKNPAYSDIKYVAELIARPTVNTVPEQTLVAFLDHGEVGEAFTADAAPAREVIARLKALGIDIDEVNAKLLRDGCAAFDGAFEDLLKSIESKAAALAG